MKLKTVSWKKLQETLPASGKQLIAQQADDTLVVYQAYRPAIANYAMAHQRFGGNTYSYDRMSWIKPNFLWMMYRCGWAVKEGQERVLAIHLPKKFFEKILAEAVPSSYKPHLFPEKNTWEAALQTKEVRLQWDPDHDPWGNKLERRAIQLGLKGSILEEFGQRQIVAIEDITDFVKEQHAVLLRDPDALLVPEEAVYPLEDVALKRIIDLP
ncbi:DUF4291 domain-containing protein [Chitinophaga qingshengii]|uniref:DUF4291 domain-containing protein n=1 Tax=Chitinophaga qingshengii TaxID=1569794 RepID=A0ABR7TSD8_9BACT|nr:DUF4291 domain-containing protein [Chitinophaga qingshengii]MBC9932309.1 DUF4291 domain-containing protein [Chitinophaga qingshengii]